jgi:hypothetical protein
MRKQDKFQKMLRSRRKYLKSQGFDDATLTLWTQGKRIPRRAQAEKIAMALGITIEEIPVRVSIVK